MCVGMGYPCSIFDELKDVPGPITELPATIETAPLPIVHFDFDPKNGTFIICISILLSHDTGCKVKGHTY